MLTDPEKRHLVRITKEQSINLLAVTESEYRNTALKWLGRNYFERLNDNQKSSITYLAYNVGASNLYKFRALRAAIRNNSHHLVKKHMVVKYKGPDGRMIENKRLNNILIANYINKNLVNTEIPRGAI